LTCAGHKQRLDPNDGDVRSIVVGLAPVLWQSTGGVTTNARLAKSAA
jgi:hypothetical protein